MTLVSSISNFNTSEVEKMFLFGSIFYLKYYKTLLYLCRLSAGWSEDPDADE